MKEGKLKGNTPLLETGTMGFLFGEAEVATVNEKNCFEVELEDEEFRTEETYSGVKELERT
jgi:hypothetical protein